MQKRPLGPVRAITFDLYGTLLDLVVSFASGFEGFLTAKDYPGSAGDVVQAWETAYLHESNVDPLPGRSHRPFEIVRRVTLSQLFFKLKIEHTDDDIEQLVTVKATPTLFPDVKENITRLQDLGRYQMSVLSNGDLQSLDNTVNGLGIPVDRAISAEQADYYKRHSGVYKHAIKELGVLAGQVRHVDAHAWDTGAPRGHCRGLYQSVWHTLRRFRRLPGRPGGFVPSGTGRQPD